MDVLEMLAERGAILRDHHFVYKKGGHGPHYINADAIFPYTSLMVKVGFALGDSFFDDRPDLVIAAATGGIPIEVHTALGLGDGSRFPYPDTVWADKTSEDDFGFVRAGYAQLLAGKRVLFVEDILNSGDTTRKVIAAARKHGAEVLGVSAICNRGGATAESLGVSRLEALATVDFQVYEASVCPLCASEVPIVEDIGHGGRFKRDFPRYAGGYNTLLS
jgi:orotate phosphoribosyltransferase